MEDVDLTGETLSSKAFLDSVANIIDIYNLRIKDNNIESDELTKLSKQLMELNAFYVTLKTQIIESRDELSSEKLKEINKLYNSYDTTLKSVSELDKLITSKIIDFETVETSYNEKIESLNTAIEDLNNTKTTAVQAVNSKIAELDQKVVNGDFDGKNGKDGLDGNDGDSAYQIWLSNGHTGSETDFLNWLKADPIDFDSLTPEQKEEIRGLKGDPFTYDMFTAEQLEALKGNAFTYDMFTPEQLEALKVKGDSFKFEDFTPEQLEALKVNGQDGKSAYELAKAKGYEGTEEEFSILLNSLLSESELSNKIAKFSYIADTFINDKSPNDTLRFCAVFKHSDCPTDAYYYYIRTTFYEVVSSSSPKTQIAYSYNFENSCYIRRFYLGVWTAWKKID